MSVAEYLNSPRAECYFIRTRLLDEELVIARPSSAKFCLFFLRPEVVVFNVFAVNRFLVRYDRVLVIWRGYLLCRLIANVLNNSTIRVVSKSFPFCIHSLR
jgi:hypothetical protein